jgi:ribosomal protein S18 acetylase RimI-like enzyme
MREATSVIPRLARPEDLPGFLRLAGEVEHWFGPMVEDEGFRSAVMRNIGRGSALVVDAHQGLGHLGGLLFGGTSPIYYIRWLVVAEQARRQGVGRALVTDALARFARQPRAVVEVVTFAQDHSAASISGARSFYERLGFIAAEPADVGPEGGPRQVYRLET